MITKSDARKILEETCGEYIAISDELVEKVTDGFNEIIESRSPTLRAPVRAEQTVSDLLQEFKEAGIEIVDVKPIYRKSKRSNRSAGG